MDCSNIHSDRSPIRILLFHSYLGMEGTKILHVVFWVCPACVWVVSGSEVHCRFGQGVVSWMTPMASRTKHRTAILRIALAVVSSQSQSDCRMAPFAARALCCHTVRAKRYSLFSTHQPIHFPPVFAFGDIARGPPPGLAWMTA